MTNIEIPTDWVFSKPGMYAPLRLSAAGMERFVAAVAPFFVRARAFPRAKLSFTVNNEASSGEEVEAVLEATGDRVFVRRVFEAAARAYYEIADGPLHQPVAD